MRDNQGDEVAAALDRLHADGWNVGDTAFYIEGSELVHVVIGSNSENQIRAEGATGLEAWRRVFDQAVAGEMLRWSRGQSVGKYEREGEASFMPVIRVWTAMPCHVAVRRFTTNRRAIGSG